MQLKNYYTLIFILIFSQSNLLSQINPNKKGDDNPNYFEKVYNPGSVAATPFAIRLPGFPAGNIKVKGDLVLVGNNIINKTTTNPVINAAGVVTNLATLTAEANTPYNTASNNNGFNQEYIDVDGDPSTFSSSTANLDIKNPDGTVNNCKKIAYAGLYWTAFYGYERNTDPNQLGIGTPIFNDWNQIKFKTPGGAYQTIIADTNADPIGDEDEIVIREYSTTNPNDSYGSPYVCYKNITNLIGSLADANGTYTVANMRAGKGISQASGHCGGWTMVIVFESPTYPSKYITVFDGYQTIISGQAPISYSVAGFKSLPAPFPVRAKLGVGALEGDLNLTGDSFNYQSPGGVYTTLSNNNNPATNFFNSSISVPTLVAPFSANVTNRNPNSSNTLGFDLDLFDVNNPSNTVIPNNSTSATIELKTTGDSYSSFLQTFAVEIIEPIIVLTKELQNTLSVIIPNNSVLALNQQLNYIIGFQNIGNDNGQFFTIKDILPLNITFDPSNPANLTLPSGVTYTYDPTTRVIIFTIPNNLVKIGDPRQIIKIRVTTVASCELFIINGCSNVIKNQAFATYKGEINTAQVSDDPSVNYFTNCIVDNADTTNFLVDISACQFVKNEVLCGTSLLLTGPPGFTNYSWTNSAGTVIGGNATQTVTQVGTYKVTASVASGCLPVIITVNVTLYGASIINPVIPFANQVVTCLSNGDQLPYIFLCGAADCRNITTGIANAISFSWEKLNTASCAATPFANCPNENPSCTWTQQPSGNTPNFSVCTAGEYRVVINFQGGCQRIFYFDVYQNVLNPTGIARDIACTTTGRITINNVPSGYEYALSAAGPWQASNVFNTNTLTNANFTAGCYTVYIRLIGAPAGSCVFQVPNLCIANANFLATQVVTQPACNGDKGKIKLDVTGVGPQYTYQITQGATLINTFGPTNSASQTFTNLAPGNYTAITTTSTGCLSNFNFTITAPPVLTVNVGVTKPLTNCSSGEFTMTPSGGTGPFSYFVNTIAATNPYTFATAGTYTIKVVDNNNCVATNTIAVTKISPPVYTVSSTNVLCYGDNTGAINFNVTNANGNSLQFSIDNGVTYSSSSSFPNLLAGDYKLIVKYSIGGVDCFTTMIIKTITQPFAKLEATGGVSELAGCGAGGTGKARITNPQGGTPFGGANPYLYSFDNGFSYSGINELYLAPGTYTLYIKDANGCTYPMPVTIDPAPTDPTINVGNNPLFNCDGTATSTVTVNNNGGNFQYEYLLDGVLNTNVPPNVFVNVVCGPHTITINYKNNNIPTFSNLLNETFGVGANTTTPGINPAYCWNYQPFPATTPCGNNAIPGYTRVPCTSPSWTLEDNQYDVTSAIIPNNCAWFPYRDHTSNGTNPQGRFLAVNIGSAAGNYGVLYSKQINNILPNQDVKVDLWLANLLKMNNGGADPDFILELVNSSNVVIASQSTGIIDNIVDAWQFRSITLNPGNNTSLTFKIRSGSILYGGNDTAIDDISVYQIPIACITTRNFPLSISCSQAFAAQVTNTNLLCAGANNGKITINSQNFGTPYGFDYRINGGPWINSQVSPVSTPATLAAGTYTVDVRYNNATPTCSFSFTQTITSPTPLNGTAVLTSPATCLTGAVITTTASGGTPAYQYQLVNTISNAIIRPLQNSNVFSNVSTGTYAVIITDVNNCSFTTTPPISVVTPVAPTAIIASTSDFCFDGLNQATLVVTASGGNPPYQYSISPGNVYGATNTFVVTPATYTINVRDNFGCVFTLPAQNIAPQLTIATTFKDLDCTVSPSATINGTVTGGYAPFTYQVSFNGGAYGASTNIAGTTFTYNTLIAGTYKIKITDNKGCTVESSVLIVNPLVNPTATTTQTNIICGGNNGSFNITASLGIAPYTYSFNGSPTFTNTTSYSGLASGTYTYTVKDQKSCTFTGSVTILPASTLAGTLAATVQYTCASSATLQIQGATGGTAPYSYSIGGAFQLSNTFTGVTNGTYTGTIKDANGCTFATNSIIITPLNPPTKLSFTNTALSCPTLTSNVTVTVTGTNTPYSYQIIAPAASATAYQTSNIFAGLSAGTYTFQVKDAKNCTYSESYTITPVVPIAVIGQLVGNVQCVGTATGTVRYTVSGFSTNYNYQINALPIVTNQTAAIINFTNQLAGTYTIVVTDNTTNCTATTSITITEPAVALSVTALATPITCIANSSVTITAVGGWGGNLYSLTNPANVTTGPQSGNIFNNLSLVGTYTASVTDSNGCTKTTTFTLVAPSAITANTLTSNLCYDGVNGATINVTASGGQAPYHYFLNGNAYQLSNVFPNLTPGTYTIKVTDAYECFVNLPAVVINPQLTLATTFVDLNCTATATISGTVSGGYPNYTYQVNYNNGGYGASTAITGTTFSYTATPGAGNYVIKITDNKGCTVESTIITISPIVPPTASNTIIDVICNGDSTGVVTINPTAGQAPFQVNFNSLGFSNSFTYSGLTAGTYNYILKDAKNCLFNGSATVSNLHAPITFTFTKQDIIVPSGNCGGLITENGEICITNISGGTAPYTIILNDQTGTNATQTITGATGTPTGQNQCFLNLGLGFIDITIVDANNCTVKVPTIQISYPPGGLTIDTSVGQATCAAGASITLTVGGTFVGTNFYYAIYTPSAGPQGFVTYLDNPAIYNLGVGASPYVFTGLDPNTFYTFVIYSSDNQCYYFRTATTAVVPLTSLAVNNLIINNVSCLGNSDASVTFTFSNYNATSVTYDIREFFGNTSTGLSATQIGLSGAPFTVSNLGPLPPGKYYIRFTINDGANTGCVTASIPFIITQSVVPLSIITNVIKNDNCKPNAGVASGIASGGSGSYTYLIFSQADAANPAIVPPYAPVSSPPTAAYTAYAAFLSTFTSATNTFNQESGNYVIFVKDSNGCVQSAPVTIGLDPTPTITTPQFASNQCDLTATSYTFTAVGLGGIAPLTYSIDGTNFQSSATFSVPVPTAATVYQVTVKDANGCTAITALGTSTTVYPPLGLTASITAQPTCNTNNGVITAGATGGTGTYAYSISPIAGTQAGNVFSNLPPNSYVITVTNVTTSCSKSSPAVTLNTPTPVTFTTTTSAVSCNAGTNGTITVNLPASNNNPIYNYSITAGPVTRPNQTSNLFTSLPAGTYTVSVTSGLNCTTVDNNVIITQPTPVTVSGIATPFACNASNGVGTSTVTITANNGTPGYTYSINNTNYFATNTFTITNTGVPQIINVYVKDANGCTANNIVNIAPIQKISSAPVTQVTPISCTNTGEVISIAVVGGSGNYTYQTLPLPSTVNATAPFNQFTLSAPGTYYFQVNDVTTGCTFATLSYTVAPFNNINAVATAGAAIPCFGGTSNISVNVTGYAGSYTYEVFNGTTSLGAPIAANTSTNPLVISGLSAGNYTVKIVETAAPLCQITTNSTTLSAPAVQLSVAITSNINANCNTGAQVTAQGSGGTPAYTYAYVIAGAAAPAVVAYSTNPTATLNPATSLSWDVYIRDANGCAGAKTNFSIVKDPTPTITTPQFASNQCDLTATSYTFTAVGLGGIAPLTYSIDGTNFQSSATFSVPVPTVATVYQVTVKDANGCTAITALGTSTTVYPPLGLTASITAQPTCNTNNGVITAGATGGTGTYVYSISPIAGTQAGNVFSNLPPNSYVITVTNVTTSCSKSSPAVSLDTPTPVTLSTPTVVNVTCNAGTDGSITVNLVTPTATVNNNPIYNYSIISGPVLFANQTSNIFSNLQTGNYIVRVTSERNCTIDQPVSVTQPAAIAIVAPIVTQFGCNTGTNTNNFATITIPVGSVTGGSGVYTTYVFIRGGVIQQTGTSNTYTVNDLAGANNFTVSVFDDKGCSATVPVPVINPYIQLLVPSVQIITPITCVAGETIKVSVTNSSGAPIGTLSYTVTGISPVVYNQTNTSGTFAGLPIGNYNIDIVNTNTNCSVQTVHYVNNPNTFNVVITNVVDVKCFGGNTGSATIALVNNAVNPNVNVGPYSYVIKNAGGATIASGNSIGTTPTVINNLISGNYTATLTLTSPTSSQCSANYVFNIVEPVRALTLTALETASVTCDNNSGVITVTPDGGTAPYVINILNTTTGVNYGTVTSGLTAGNYTITVTDANLCTFNSPLTLTQPPAIYAALAPVSPLLCNGDETGNVSVILPVTGGQGGNYTFTLNATTPGAIFRDGPTSASIFYDLGAGTYTVTIQDGFNCVYTTLPVTITAPTIITPSLTLNTAPTCSATGILTLSATGGTPPYVYSADGLTFSTTTFNPSVNIVTAGPGTYSYFIKDANNCISQVSSDITLINVTPISIATQTQRNITCFGSSDGEIHVEAQGGYDTNYTYVLSTTLGGAALQTNTTGDFLGLIAQQYYIRIITVGDCKFDSTAITVTQPVQFIVTATTSSVKCNGDKNGTITISTTNGIGQIQYAISPNLNQFFTLTSNPFVINNLAPGFYDIVVSDQANCPYTSPTTNPGRLEVLEPTAINSSLKAIISQSPCTSDALGSFSINISGGTPGYQVSIDTGAFVNANNLAGPNTHVVSGLIGGSHVVHVRDSNMCIVPDYNVLLDPSVTLDPKFTLTYPCKTPTSTDFNILTITVDPSIVLSDVKYSLDGGAYQSSNVFTNLSPGNHVVGVKHINGCLQPTTTITVVFIDPLTLTLTDGNLNQIIAVATGGLAPYTFDFNGVNTGSDNTYIFNQTGNYFITVTDTAGCLKQVSKTFNFIDIFIPNFFTPDGDGNNDGWGPVNTFNYKNLEFYIFDRYGRKVGTFREGEFWDGRYQGTELPSGDYWYVVKLDGGNSDREFVGNFTLYR